MLTPQPADEQGTRRTSHTRRAVTRSVGVMHVLYNPGPLALIIAPNGQLMDAFTWINADPTDRTLARLIRRRALIDLGPIPDSPPEE